MIVSHLHTTRNSLYEHPTTRPAVSIAAGVDVDADARRRFTERTTRQCTRNRGDVETVDAVLVTTPNRYHEQYVVAALDAEHDGHVETARLAHTLETPSIIQPPEWPIGF